MLGFLRASVSAQGTETESSKRLSRSWLCVFLHPEEFQVSGPQLSCRGVAAGGQVHRAGLGAAGLGAAGLGCFLGPDSGEFCPLQRSPAWGGLQRWAQAQPGVGTRPGVRQCPRAESAPFSRSVRGGVPPCTQDVQLVQAAGPVRPRAPLGARHGLRSSASLAFLCWPLHPVLSVTASAAF